MSIIVKNLTHIYNEGMPFASKALDDVSFEIKDRDFCWSYRSYRPQENLH
nr:hypothetical protein [Clostridioides difficile]